MLRSLRRLSNFGSTVSSRQHRRGSGTLNFASQLGCAQQDAVSEARQFDDLREQHTLQTPSRCLIL